MITLHKYTCDQLGACQWRSPACHARCEALRPPLAGHQEPPQDDADDFESSFHPSSAIGLALAVGTVALLLVIVGALCLAHKFHLGQLIKEFWSTVSAFLV